MVFNDIRNRIIRVLVVPIALALFFPLMGCDKKIREIESDEVIDALEGVLNLEEADDGDSGASYYSVADDLNYCEYRIDAYVNKYNAFNGDSISISFTIYDDSADAEKFFSGLYTQYMVNGEDDFMGYYSEGKSGYIVHDDGDCFLGLYYVNDRVVDIAAYSEDNVESAKAFLEEIKLPTE